MQPFIPTQLQLTAQQRTQLRELALRDGRGLSDVAREAIDLYLLDRPVPPTGLDVPSPALAASVSRRWERA